MLGAASEAFARMVEEGQRVLAAAKEQEREVRRARAELQAEREAFAEKMRTETRAWWS